MSNVIIAGTLGELKALMLKTAGKSKVFIIMDEHLRHLRGYFEGCDILTITPSELNKNIETIAGIIGKLLDYGADRDAVVVGVGGGITTDITGFAASVYKRGVKFASVPTTLLAQVDASIGGKNGVNFESYKNIIGTINQPQWVYICAEVLRTLGRREFVAGIAEVLKTFILFDEECYGIAVEYFSELERKYKEDGTYLIDGKFYKEDCLLDIIGKCAVYKCGVVERDEFEKGERRMLNLGHTFAHAIEKVCADNENYCPVMHGEAVSIGMVIAARMAAKYYGLDGGFAEKLKSDLQNAGLPTEIPFSKAGVQIPVTVLLEALKKDKKVAGNAIHFILPKKVGNVCDELLYTNVVEGLANDLC